VWSGFPCAQSSFSLSFTKMANKIHKSDYATPIPDRTAPTDWLRTIQFAILFNFLVISTNISQFVALFLLYPLEVTRPYYERCISYSKAVFSRLIVTISQLFAPTKIVLSCSDEDGNYLDPETLVKRNQNGRIIEVNLPDRSIWISNHQVRTYTQGKA
jgi:lysocardiolipin and lysophospholipid acyltransferase